MKKHFIRRIVKSFTKEGCKCSFDNNKLIVSIEEKCFEVEISDAIGWLKRKVDVSLSFAFENMDKVQPEGLLWLASESNNDSKCITTRVWKDHFSCRYKTIVIGPKDFLKEFYYAIQEFGKTYVNLFQKYDVIKTNSMNVTPQRRPIGYLASKYMINEINTESCN